jgi:hypothetical protein
MTGKISMNAMRMDLVTLLVLVISKLLFVLAYHTVIS